MAAMTQAKPAAACSRQTCEGCEIRGRLLCVHTPRDVVGFVVLFVIWAIPFFAGMVIGRFWIGLGVWGGLALLFFGYVEQLLLCRHCPHYAELGFFLRCHANWGLPKIPSFNPRPMSRVEGATWLLYGAVLFFYCVPFFVISHQWLLLGITTLALVVAVWLVRRTRCPRCYHLSCPANRLPEDVRAVFLKNYPGFSQRSS